MKDKFAELPKGWGWTRIGDAISNVSLTGKKLKQSAYQVIGKYPVIDQGQKFIGGYTDKEEFKISSDTPLIIFGDHTKVFKYIDFQFVAGADGVKVLKPEEVYFPKLFYYFAQAVRLPEKGYARHFQWLEKSLIPLPPLPEQHRIIAKIEELFTKLDAGVEALKKIKAQLKRYRQAVLKYALEGKLTQGWREVNKGKIEPASVLLERIKEERKKDAKGKYKELPPIDTSDLPELPEGWEWTYIEGFADLISGQHILKENYNCRSDGLPYLTGPADFSHKFPIISKWTTNPKVISKYNDVLVTVKGAGVGKVNILNIDKAIISRQLMAIRGDYSHSHYIFFFIDSNFHKLQRLGAGSTIPGIDRETILKMPFPFPPFHEQNKIVEEIESRLSIADNMERVVEQSQRQSDRLRQSILKNAFEGKLVPQDPTDEPAEKLLERIKEEKARRETENKREKKNKIKNQKQMELI
jgi:type I restriction enzyme S subunit